MPVARIEAAITRLETAARHPGARTAPAPAGDPAAIEAANARLRAALGGVLQQIDSLIARHDAGAQR